MRASQSLEVEATLQRPEVHRQWESAYRTEENERFYNQAFDYIASVLQAPRTSPVLDVGCGSGAHAIRLAKRGFTVLAVDLSEHVLSTARDCVQNTGFQDRITLQRENVQALSFADRTFDHIVCWGVLMHIPDIEKALAELARVLRKDGVLVIGENNMASLQVRLETLLLWGLKRLGKEITAVTKTSAGLEYWRTTPFGRLLTRRANIRWLETTLQGHGLGLKRHVAGQFTELYTRLPSALLRRLLHCFNEAWFRRVRSPRNAFGNILVFERRS